MKHYIIHTLLVCTMLVLGACKKTPGQGGTATVNGKVWVEDWNTAFTVKNGEYNAADEDVYLLYGDDISYGDKTKTNFNGEFEFKYLRKGDYKIYVYSKDKSLKSQSGDTALIQQFSVNERKQTLSLTTFTIYK